MDWLFVNDQEDESKIDFEFVAAHGYSFLILELTHGLGFGGSFVHYTEIFPNAQPGYIAPLMLIVNDSDFSSTTMVNVVEPCSIFDSYLYTRRGFSFKRLSAAISSFGNRRLPVFKFLEEFETSGMPFRASQFAYNVSKMGERSLFFHTIDDKRIPLYTPTDFLQGSSISHIELLNANTNNFLMIPSVGRGITLEQLISQSDTHSLYGDRLLSMMESIGWPTIRNSVPRDIQLQVRYPEDVKFQIFSDPFSPVEVAANAANCGFFTFWTLLSLYILI